MTQDGFRAISSGGTAFTAFNVKAFPVIKEYERQVFFTQCGLSKDKDSSTLNAGLGFYHLMPNSAKNNSILAQDIIVGGTVFYDAKTGTENLLNPFGEGVHKRYSVGGAIMNSQAGAFFNIYKGHRRLHSF